MKTKKDYTSGVLWIIYLLTIAAIVALFTVGCVSTQRVNPADMKFNKETINPAKNMKALKLRRCN
jgi:hypothetical protein